MPEPSLPKGKGDSHQSTSQNRGMGESQGGLEPQHSKKRRVRARAWSAKNELHAERKGGFKEEKKGKQREPCSEVGWGKEKAQAGDWNQNFFRRTWRVQVSL